MNTESPQEESTVPGQMSDLDACFARAVELATSAPDSVPTEQIIIQLIREFDEDTVKRLESGLLATWDTCFPSERKEAPSSPKGNVSEEVTGQQNPDSPTAIRDER